jgi:hypothetical protein
LNYCGNTTVVVVGVKEKKLTLFPEWK